jgi:dTDP-4-dehydrorhamnose 3,5-epimerase
MLKGAIKDKQTVTVEGRSTKTFIDGVYRTEVQNIVTRNGITTELYRPEWPGGPDQVRHAIHVVLRPRAISAWHVHEEQLDAVFVTDGTVRLVLFDDREGSATRGELNEFLLSRLRPAVITVPPGVWHGLQNVEDAESSFFNYFNRPYKYEDPDEWRLPADTDQIPYRFS